MNTGIATRTIAALLAIAISGVAPAQDAPGNAYRDAKVANFALPGHGHASPGYESFSFWSGPQGEFIDYDYNQGAEHRQVRVRAAGPSVDGDGFAVRFPNGLVLDIVPRGAALRVSDRRGHYGKTFEWRYEGPVDGRGTFCTPCVDEADAIGFVRRHFME